MKSILVTKASGEIVPFSTEKLRHSLRRSGANNEIIDKIIDKIKNELYPGISTKKLYQHAFGMLKNTSKSTAAKYKLKQAIMELGPSGFSFEKYMAEILKYQGFNVKVGEIVKGYCVNHEIDVIAEKDNTYCMIECKYHNLAGIHCDVKIPLYIYSRFKDVEKYLLNIPDQEKKVHQGWVVTNTKFTSDAIQYGTCIGLNLIGWDFPKNNGLREQIDLSGLYPVTCLTTLTSNEKQLLLDNNIVLCKEIKNNHESLGYAHISAKRKFSILNEVNSLCS